MAYGWWRRAEAGRRRERGFTLLELMLAVCVVSVGLLGLLSVIKNGLDLDTTSRESHIALVEARKKLEEMKAAPFGELYDRYQSGGVIGNAFTLTAPVQDATGVKLPTLQSANGTITFLTEPQAASRFGVASFDCNRDYDTADSPDASWRIYPIRIRITWLSRGQTRQVELYSVIYNHNR